MNETESRPLLTIAIPTYNSRGLIRTTLEGLMLQCRDADNVEVIISDNASTDNTKEIIDEVREIYPQIKYVRNAENLGCDGNFLSCMQLATGKFILLLADDDILIEGALQIILDFLTLHPDLSLVFLNTVTFHSNYVDLEHCSVHKTLKPVRGDIYTRDKTEFMEYAGRLIGFLSSYILSKDRFLEIENPEQYLGTRWLHGYVDIMCTRAPGAAMGVISRPCIAMGCYVLPNVPTVFSVFGKDFKKMMLSAEQAGYDKKQLNRLFCTQVCWSLRRKKVKITAMGVKVTWTDFKSVFICTWMYPKAWLTLYPFFLIPGFMCKFIADVFVKVKLGLGGMNDLREQR